ncbi:hypothetical protein [Corynebacterium sp. H113]|uniref:hypothetical protein n=1 Tax=Corynebacterium sp. H113 TaxID=3133419 RepID=UPI0030AEF0C1
MSVYRGRRATAASVSCALLAVVMPVVATAQPAVPTAPDDDSIAEQWGSASARGSESYQVVGESMGPLALSIDSVSPQVAAPENYVSVQVTVRNTSEQKVSDIALRLQRGERLNGVEDARTSLANAENAFGYVTNFGDSFSLKPKERKTVTVTAPVDANAPEGLSINEAGVYPLLINANGAPGNDIVQFLAETRTLLPVNTPPDPENEAPDVPLSLVWPLAETVPVVPGETGDAPEAAELIMSDESLARSLEPGGRLDTLLATLESGMSGPNGAQLKKATCVAIDPETLDAVVRMSDGYLVGASRPSPVKKSQRLRDSWGNNDNEGLTEGTGAEAAADWLARFRSIASDTCVFSLPWASAEVNAIAKTNDVELVSEGLFAGTEVVATQAETTPLNNVIAPPEGYLTPESVRWLSPRNNALRASSELTPYPSAETTASPEQPNAEAQDPATPPESAPSDSGVTTALVAGNSLTRDDGNIALSGETGVLAENVHAFAVPGALTAALAATGSKPEQAGFSALEGRYDLALDSSQARMQTAVGTLHQEIADSAAAAQVMAEQAETEEATPGEETEAERPTPEPEQTARSVVAVPPTSWSVSKDDVTAWLTAVSGTFDAGTTTPVPLYEVINESATKHNIGSVKAAAPNPDPGATPDSEVLHVQQLSRELTSLAQFMADDPNVTLTRYGFTLPLRRDLLRSFSSEWRRNRAEHVAMDTRARSIRNGAGSMVDQLRNSVSLVTPGGLFTRATGMSPIVVLGRNGLPLPVPVVVRVKGDGGDEASKHSAVLPAKGSVTVQLDPQTHGQTSHKSLEMWLETPAGTQISTPTDVAIRSGVSTTAIIIFTALLAIGALIFGATRSRRFRK